MAFLAGRTCSRRPLPAAEVPTPSKRVAARITGGTPICRSGPRAITCAPGFSVNRKTTSKYPAGLSFTSNNAAAGTSDLGRDRGIRVDLTHFLKLFSAKLAHNGELGR